MIRLNELAHIRHTRRVREAAVIAGLIRDHDRVRANYINALKTVSRPIEPTTGPPDPRDPTRLEWLRVEMALVQRYWPDPDEVPTRNQALMEEWRRDLCSVLERLNDHFIRANQEHKFKLFPLVRWLRSGIGPSDSADTVSMLDRHISALDHELEDIDPAALIPIQYRRDPPAMLRKARKKLKHTQERAAAECKVSLDTYKAWERDHGTAVPQPKNATAAENYVIRAFTTGFQQQGVRTKEPTKTKDHPKKE